MRNKNLVCSILILSLFSSAVGRADEINENKIIQLINGTNIPDPCNGVIGNHVNGIKQPLFNEVNMSDLPAPVPEYQGITDTGLPPLTLPKSLGKPNLTPRKYMKDTKDAVGIIEKWKNRGGKPYSDRLAKKYDLTDDVSASLAGGKSESLQDNFKFKVLSYLESYQTLMNDFDLFNSVEELERSKPDPEKLRLLTERVRMNGFTIGEQIDHPLVIKNLKTKLQAEIDSLVTFLIKEKESYWSLVRFLTKTANANPLSETGRKMTEKARELLKAFSSEVMLAEYFKNPAIKRFQDPTEDSLNALFEKFPDLRLKDLQNAGDDEKWATIIGSGGLSAALQVGSTVLLGSTNVLQSLLKIKLKNKSGLVSSSAQVLPLPVEPSTSAAPSAPALNPDGSPVVVIPDPNAVPAAITPDVTVPMTPSGDISPELLNSLKAKIQAFIDALREYEFRKKFYPGIHEIAYGGGTIEEQLRMLENDTANFGNDFMITFYRRTDMEELWAQLKEQATIKSLPRDVNFPQRLADARTLNRMISAEKSAEGMSRMAPGRIKGNSRMYLLAFDAALDLGGIAYLVNHLHSSVEPLNKSENRKVASVEMYPVKKIPHAPVLDPFAYYEARLYTDLTIEFLGEYFKQHPEKKPKLWNW